MRGVGVVLLVAALVAACGGEETSSQTEDSAAATTPVPPATSAAPSTPATTAEPRSMTTVAAEPTAQLVELHPDGIGVVDFGTPADEALADLSATLGAPDRVETIEPDVADCVEGSSWLDCVHARRVVDEGQVAVWDGLGLEIALVDTDHDGSRAALQFGDWHATLAASDTRLITPEGIYPGMTVGALKEAVPGVEFTFNEGALDSFYTASPEGAGYWGRLDWNPATTDIDSVDVGAVQTALVEHGADLAVDGTWGPRTQAAWLAFLAEQSIEPATGQLWLTPEIGTALGLPPEEITVATIEPRPAIDPATPLSAATPLRRRR